MGLYFEPLCPHNKQIPCEGMNCNNCGWNPVVAERRIAKVSEAIKKRR